MSGLLWWLILLFLGVLALVIAVLSTPAIVSFRAGTEPNRRLRITARLLGGVTPAIPIHDSARRRQKSEAKAARRRRGRGRRYRVIAATPELLAGLLRQIHLVRLRVDADIGLVDPADTGLLFGLFAAISKTPAAMPAISITVRPDFTRPRAEGELDAALRFIPMAFVPPGVRFAFKVFGSRS